MNNDRLEPTKEAGPLSWLHIPDERLIPDSVKALWAKAEEKLGFVPKSCGFLPFARSTC